MAITHLSTRQSSVRQPSTAWAEGSGNKRSQQWCNLTRVILASGEGMRVGRGENRQTHVYVPNLSDFYVLLVEQAAAGRGKATWEKEGCYFVHRGEQVVAIGRVPVPTWQAAPI
jgi:hypothetical protein